MTQPAIAETGASFLTTKAVAKHPVLGGKGADDGFAAVMKTLLPPKTTVPLDSESEQSSEEVAEEATEIEEDDTTAAHHQGEDSPSEQGKLMPIAAVDIPVTAMKQGSPARAEHFALSYSSGAVSVPKQQMPASYVMNETKTQIDVPVSGHWVKQTQGEASPETGTTLPRAAAKSSEPMPSGQVRQHPSAGEPPVSGETMKGTGPVPQDCAEATVLRQHWFGSDSYPSSQGITDNRAVVPQQNATAMRHPGASAVPPQAEPVTPLGTKAAKIGEELQPLSDLTVMRSSDAVAALHAPISPRSDVAVQVPPPVRQVLQQLAETPIAHGDHVEITLSPEELGRVHLSARQTDQGVILLVQAERPETLDLMRRYLPDLMQDLQRMGFGDVSYSDKRPNQHMPQQPRTTQAHPETLAESPQYVAVSGLDLRL